MKFQHGAMFNAKYLMAACFMNSDEKDAVTEIVCKKNNLNIDDRTIGEVTLENIVPKQTTIEINFNTGIIKKRTVSSEKSKDEIENKIVLVNPVDDNRAEVNTVWRKTRTTIKKPLVDKKEEIYKILEDSDDEDISSNHGGNLSQLNEIESEAAISPFHDDQNLLDTNLINNDKMSETVKQFHTSVKETEVSGSEKLISSVSETVRIHNRNNELSSPSVIKPKRQFKCDQCPVSYSWKNSLIPHKKKKHGTLPKFSRRGASSFKSGQTVKREIEENISEQVVKQIKVENPTTSLIHVCYVCDDKFETELDLDCHRNMHTKVSVEIESEGSKGQDGSVLENRECDEQFIVNTDIENGVFVVIGVDASVTNKEEQLKADPFCSSIREKLEDDVNEKEALLEEHEIEAHDDNVTIEELASSDVFTAVNVALENEFLIM